MRLLAAALLVLVGLAATAAPAVPKEGVQAVADEPVRLGADPGTRLRVSWRLIDAEGRPFGAGGIHLRVRRCGGKLLRVRARARGNGRFSARFEVPRGGIRRLTVGLPGWRTYPSGRSERADAIFPFVPALERRCA